MLFDASNQRIERDEKNSTLSALDKLKERIKAAAQGINKIVMVPKSIRKFKCPNHKMATFISMGDSSQRMQKSHQTMEEYSCECGTIYRRGDA